MRKLILASFTSFTFMLLGCGVSNGDIEDAIKNEAHNEARISLAVCNGLAPLEDVRVTNININESLKIGSATIEGTMYERGKKHQTCKGDFSFNYLPTKQKVQGINGLTERDIIVISNFRKGR